MSIQKIFAIGVGSFLVGVASIGHVDGASAAYRRVHAGQCHAATDDVGPNLDNSAWLNTTSINRNIYCAAPSDSELPHSSTVTLNVYGYTQYATSAYSKACIYSVSTATALCGPFKYWGAGRVGASGVSVAEWADVGGMPYLFNYLPAGSSLYGFFMST